MFRRRNSDIRMTMLAFTVKILVDTEYFVIVCVTDDKGIVEIVRNKAMCLTRIVENNRIGI